MPRPKRKRLIEHPPPIDGFKPFGVPIQNLEPVILLYEEYEAMRLADYEGMNQEQAAEKMQVSRPTFTRIYDRARRNVAKAFVEGKALMIEGGDFHSENYWYKCEACQKLNVSDLEMVNCRYCQANSLRLING
ncbi:DUF134 domain-containing protein [Carboxylicivirga sp. A043]|uniref:DUF134 domain-containing protein n=1 Tax=Carboxylicivirga litoralis TaxID=2816963 RepID=UPI0021CB7746|nr:DUF134 domain-containing protein [Carboxylicivirga sp. A043]MCU4157301.1 DUF134 domain-containing protein [Carboxylicivirga sp. A043]